MWFTYPHAIPYGVLLPDGDELRATPPNSWQWQSNLATRILS